jgi:UDP-glucose-4-epimerase GalE
MQVLVTGGAGYVGSHTTRYLLQQGHRVCVYDNLSRGHAQAVPPDVLVVGDLADTPTLDALLARFRPEVVMHFAAKAYVGESVQQPAEYYQTNLVCTFNLLEAMRRAGVHRLVFSSTCATYGIPEQLPITEDCPQQPINPYGRSKLAVEWILRDYAASYGWGVAILRYFNAAGAAADGTIGEAHDPETHLIPLVIQQALGQRPVVELFGTDYPTPDGTCVRDYVHVEDLASAHALAMLHLESGRVLAYNLGMGKGYSVREVIQAVESVSGCSVAVRECKRRPGDPPVLVASCERITRELGWRPRYNDLQAVVSSAWRWHSTHPKGYRS